MQQSASRGLEPPVGRARSGRLLRRYPALAGVSIMAALALLLPSALTLPQSAPPTLAEYAPVPGSSSNAAPAPLAELGFSSSGGIGSGGTGEGVGTGGGVSTTTTPAPVAAGGGRRRAGTKRCVGKPARQTEDPMSPPCIAFFDGDNFGATSKGVTESEIRVVFLTPSCNQGGDELVDFDNPDGRWPATPGLLKWFSDRYQMYGRRLHGWSFTPACGPPVDEQARGAVATLDERVAPFLIIPDARRFAATEEAIRRRIMILDEFADRGFMARSEPYDISYGPDIQGWVETTVQFVCHKLAGRRARYSGVPTDSSKVRKFAFVYENPADPRGDGGRLFRDRVKDECGDAVGEIATAGATTAGEASQTVTRWRAEGVTTVVQMSGEGGHATSADSIGWHPEWLLSPRFQERATPPQPDGRPYRKQTMALYHVRRQPPGRENQYWYQAVRESCSSCPANVGGLWAYDMLMLASTGIQAAGPRLTPVNVARGLRAIAPYRSFDPFSPAAYFSAADLTFVKDTMLFRWDATAQCWRLPKDGQRFRAEDWRTDPGDDGFDDPRWPCQG